MTNERSDKSKETRFTDDLSGEIEMKRDETECRNCGCQEATHPIPECKVFQSNKQNTSVFSDDDLKRLKKRFYDPRLSCDGVDGMTRCILLWIIALLFIILDIYLGYLCWGYN